MSGSSGEEMADVGLNIKPPQHRRDRAGRSRDDDRNRWGGEDRYRGNNRGDSHRRDRNQYYDERSHGSSFSQRHDMDREGRRYDDFGPMSRRDMSESNSSRGSRRIGDLDKHFRGENRSRQLHKSMKQKRKHLELEEHRTLREIERRHRREKRGEDRCLDKRRRKHDDQDQSHPSNVSDHDERLEEAFNKKKSVPERDVYLPTVEEFIKSSPESEEGEKLDEVDESKIEEQPYHSDVLSSESDQEDSQMEEGKSSKVPSETGSKSADSDSSSSKSSESESEESSDSKSSNEGSDDKSGKTKSKIGKQQTLADVVGDSEKTDKGQSSDVEVMEIEKKEEKPKIDESLLTEVDRAIQEVSLLPPYFPAVQGCRRVEEFSLLNRIEEGTYGVVYRAKDKRTDEVVALKRLKMEKEKDGFPITSLREINTLLKAQHENIVTVREIVVGSNTDKIFLVMDYVEHDLKSLMETLKQKSQMFLIQEVKCLMIQLLRAVAHLHDNWILHRDLKTSNLLLSHKGILKVGDFGLAREYGSPLKSYTPIVVTLWYRAPELLLGTKEYSTPIDVWSVGCIFGELIKMEPMFPGKSDANQLNLIFQTLGTPNDRIWPGYTQLPIYQKIKNTFVDQPMNKLNMRFGGIGDKGIDLMNKLLTYNPAKRLTADDALSHSFFKESPLPIDPAIFPTWPAKSELGHRKAPSSPKPPSGGRQFKDLRDDDDSSSGFFLGTTANDRRIPMGGGFSLKF